MAAGPHLHEKVTESARLPQCHRSTLGEGPLLHAKFHPQRCNDKGIGPQKTEIFTEIFIIIRNINAPPERISWAIFTKFAHFVRRFRMR